MNPPLLSRAAGAPGGPRPAWAGRAVGAVFEEVAAAQGDRAAVDSGASRASYADLGAHARRIAGELLARWGPRPRQVALLFDPGPEAAAAILGVLEAGHAYVPLNPADPEARSAFVLDDAEAVAILTDGGLANAAAALGGNRIPVVRVDEVEERGAAAGPPPVVSPDAPAYLMYTSGSTGQPKGVIQTHRNLLHFVECYGAGLDIRQEDRLALLFSLSFSASNMDVFGALLHGATLAPWSVRTRGTVDLARWIEGQGITVLHLVPSLFRHLLEQGEGPRSLSGVRAIDLAGEPVFPSDVRLWRTHCSAGCVLVNHLGATEASVIAQHAVDREREYAGATVPVGRAAAGIEIEIVREDGSPTGAGEVGEIVVQSPHLSPGYWRRPELTRATFADDPRRPGWRSYRSGDLGRLDASGLLETVGRKDDRVKIRGHSVHLAEVEAALRGLAGVRDAVVVMRSADDAASQEPRLVAYLVAPGLPAAELRAALARRLPAYMLPAEWVALDALPLSPNGKVDRRTLAALAPPAACVALEFTFPRDALELSLRTVWERVLDRSPLGTDDDFFALGGSSLQAMSLYAEIRRGLGVELPVDTLLRFPTIARLAAAIRERGFRSPASCVVPLQEGGARPPFFMVHGLDGAVLPYVYLARHLGHDRPFFGVQAPGSDRLASPELTFERLAAMYVAEIREAGRGGPYHIGGYCTGGLLAFEVACQLEAAGERVGVVTLLEPVLVLPWVVRILGLLYATALGRGWLDTPPARRLQRIVRHRRAARAEQRLRSGANVFPQLGPEQARVMLALGRKRRAYRPRPFPGAVQLILTDSARGQEERTARFWSALCREVEIHHVPGHHLSVLGIPAVAAVAEHVAQAIEAVERRWAAT